MNAFAGKNALVASAASGTGGIRVRRSSAEGTTVALIGRMRENGEQVASNLAEGVELSSTQVVAQVGSAKNRDRKKAGALFTLGGLLFLLLTTVSEAIYPNFSLRTNAISDLAAIGTRSTLFEETAILGLGVCWVGGAYYLFRNSGKRKKMALYILPGFGYLLAGISPENVNIVLHSIGAPLAFVLGSVAAMLSYHDIRSQFRYFSVGLGALALVSTFIIFVGGQIGPCGSCGGLTPDYLAHLESLGLGLGGFESLIIYPLLIWLIGFGSHLMATSNQGSERY